MTQTLDLDLVKPAQAALTEAKSAIDAIAANFKVDEAGNFVIEKKQYADYTAAVASAKEAKAFLDSVHEAKSIEEFLTAPVGTPQAAVGAAQNLGAQSLEAKSLADVFMDSAEFKAAQEAGFTKSFVMNGISGELEGKSIHSLTAGTYTVPALGSTQLTGITERATRKTRIRDLFPKGTTKAAQLMGVIETGWVNNAKQVRQRYAADGTSAATGGDTDVFGHKPKSKITLRNVVYPVATIAHTLDAHKNILDDEPRLRQFLNMRMAEGVKYAEDYDLLHSVGGAEEITGLFNVTGVQNYTGQAADKYSVQIRRAITKAQLAEYDPTGIVISPEMWENVEVEEDGYGGFRVAVNVAVGAVKQVWHLDVACTTAMSDENFLIGAFGLGAQLWDREAVNVTMSTENADNFERNVVTFRAEERIALEVPRPESFVIGTWTEPTP